MPKHVDRMIPDDFETTAVEFADRIRRFVLREVNQALDGIPDAQKRIRRWNGFRAGGTLTPKSGLPYSKIWQKLAAP